jgi:hypothetical protein
MILNIIKNAWLLLVVLVLSVQLASADQLLNREDAAGSYAQLEVDVAENVISAEELDSVSGRQIVAIDDIDIQLNNMQLNAEMGENVLYSNRTGLNVVTNDAFTGASGIATVIQNSGNQVIINNALILNMTVE